MSQYFISAIFFFWWHKRLMHNDPLSCIIQCFMLFPLTCRARLVTLVTIPRSPSVHWSLVPGLSSPQAADSWEVVTSVMRTQLCSGSRHRNLSLMSLSPAKWPPGASRERRWPETQIRIIRGNNPLHDARIPQQGRSWGLINSIRSLRNYR